MVSDLQKTTASIEELNMEIRERKQIEEKQKKLLNELREAFSKVKALSDFLPICASCKKTKDDKVTGARLSHISAILPKRNSVTVSVLNVEQNSTLSSIRKDKITASRNPPGPGRF